MRTGIPALAVQCHCSQGIVVWCCTCPVCWRWFPAALLPWEWHLAALSTLPEGGDAPHSIRCSCHLGFWVGLVFVAVSGMGGGKPGVLWAVGLESPLGQKGLGRERREFGSGKGWELLGCVIPSCWTVVPFPMLFFGPAVRMQLWQWMSSSKTSCLCRSRQGCLFFISCSLSRGCQLNRWDLTGL